MAEETGAVDTLQGGSRTNNVEAFAALIDGPRPEENPQENASVEEVSEADADEIVADGSEGEEILDEVSEEPAESPPLYTVKVNGEDSEVTLEELQKGYSRNSDYTRKTMELANERKSLATQQAQMSAIMNEYQNALANQTQATEEPEPDWDKLYVDDPIDWIRQRELWREKREIRQQKQAEQQRLQQAAVGMKQAELQKAVDEQRQVLQELIPEWKDEELAHKEKTQIRRYGKSLGFSEQELAGMYDSRAVIALQKAMKYDQLQAKRGKIRPASEGKTLAPGSSESREPNQLRRGKAMAQLKKSGHIRDAASVFEQFIQ
jgi:hypothetical protein